MLMHFAKWLEAFYLISFGQNVETNFPACNVTSICVKYSTSKQPHQLQVKGILHQNFFYRLNLIFWIVMGCGMARFSRRGLKTTETWKFWSQNLSPGVLRRGAPGVSRHSAMGFRGAAQGFRGAAPRGFEGQRQGVSRGSATDKRLQWFIISRCPSRSHLITRDLEGWYHEDGTDFLIYIYGIQCDFMPTSCWKHSNFENR